MPNRYLNFVLAVLALIVLAVPAASLSQTPSGAKVPFLFSEDDKLPQNDFTRAIPKTSALRDNKYLNTPLTRLEYMLTKLEALLDQEQNRDAVLAEVGEGFEQDTGKYPISVRVSGYARYEFDSGRVVVGYRVQELGKPRRPMRQTCDNVLANLEVLAPQETDGLYWYHNTVLGVLAQKPFSEYSPVLETLAKNLVHVVVLESHTENRRVHHNLGCMRMAKNAPTIYTRHSFSLAGR